MNKKLQTVLGLSLVLFFPLLVIGVGTRDIPVLPGVAEDETGPGLAVPREDKESNNMWIPVIIIVVVFGIVILRKNAAK